MKIVNAWTYNYKDNPGEVNTKPSLTVPDQSISVLELYQRFARGLPLEGKEGVYDLDEDGEGYPVPDFSKMDLAERQEKLEEITEWIDNRKIALKEARDKKQKADEAKKARAQEYTDAHQGSNDAAHQKYPKKTPPEGPRSEQSKGAVDSEDTGR